MFSDVFFPGMAVEGEIVDHDDTWVVFRYIAKKYEKVPETSGEETFYHRRPVKGAEVTLCLRISDIDSIDEVTDEDRDQ